jgi:hypothetical protein
MITIGALLAFFGFFSGYNASRKAVLRGDSRLELWLRRNASKAKISGVFLLVASLILVVTEKGLGAGSLMFVVVLMTIGSLVVILSPLRLLTLRSALLIFALSFLFEMSTFL